MSTTTYVCGKIRKNIGTFRLKKKSSALSRVMIHCSQGSVSLQYNKNACACYKKNITQYKRGIQIFFHVDIYGAPYKP